MPNTSMNMLIHLAENEVGQHVDLLQRLNSERSQASTQLSTLRQYRHDYSDRLLQASQSGVTMSNYHNFYRFIGTLDQAITQQNSLLEHLEAKITQQQQQCCQTTTQRIPNATRASRSTTSRAACAFRAA